MGGVGIIKNAACTLCYSCICTPPSKRLHRVSFRALRLYGTAPLMTKTWMFLFLSLAFISLATCYLRVRRARAIIYRAVRHGIPNTAIGIVNLKEYNRVVTITGRVNGLPPGLHGFHVHEFGDISNGCLAAGSHFNPFEKNHGSPENDHSKRHVGDLGNIRTFRNGTAIINIRDYLIALSGIRGIVGRAFVIHAKKDDLGSGWNKESLKTGNAGARLACGIIGYVGK